MKRETALPVYVYNSVEDEWAYISGLKSRKERSTRITLSNAFADSYLFANAGRPRFVFISPVAVSPVFRSYFEKLSSSEVTVITPDMSHSFSISENLVNDKKALRQLVNAAKDYSRVHLFPYSATPWVYDVKRALDETGVKTFLPESPDEKDVWTVATYGSKSGFRELVTSMKDDAVRMPPGSVHHSPSIALEAAYATLRKKGAALLKVARGSGGHGTHMLNSKSHTKKHIRDILESNPFWKKQHIVVEEFIETDKASTVRFPSIEGYIDAKGKWYQPYTCNMLVTPEGNYLGMEVGPEALPKDVHKRMIRICAKIGKVYAAKGYRGHFDIDMILGKNGRLYVDESNVRNTGGTDAYKITVHLLGQKRFEQSFLLSKYFDLPEKTKLPSFSVLMKKAAPLLYNRQTKEGIIISSEAAFKERSLSYFIIARSRKRAYRLESSLITLATA